jgi:DNA-binding LytR/AlgR family response regulator
MGSNKKEINLLICEDDTTQQKLLIDTIKHYGFVNIVGCVSTGEEMLEKAIELDVTALLLDLQLPGDINGLEAYSLLGRRGKQIPAVLVTGAKPNISYVYDLDIIDMVEKPYTTNRLWQAFQKLQGHIEYTRFVEGGGLYIPAVSEGHIQMLLPNEVLFIESVNRKVQLHIKDDVLETKIRLGAYENYLQNHGFLLTHRSCLVNTSKICDVKGNTIYFDKDLKISTQIAESNSYEVRNILRQILPFEFI